MRLPSIRMCCVASIPFFSGMLMSMKMMSNVVPSQALIASLPSLAFSTLGVSVLSSVQIISCVNMQSSTTSTRAVLGCTRSAMQKSGGSSSDRSNVSSSIMFGSGSTRMCPHSTHICSNMGLPAAGGVSPGGRSAGRPRSPGERLGHHLVDAARLGTLAAPAAREADNGSVLVLAIAPRRAVTTRRRGWAGEEHRMICAASNPLVDPPFFAAHVVSRSTKMRSNRIVWHAEMASWRSAAEHNARRRRVQAAGLVPWGGSGTEVSSPLAAAQRYGARGVQRQGTHLPTVHQRALVPERLDPHVDQP